VTNSIIFVSGNFAIQTAQVKEKTLICKHISEHSLVLSAYLNGNLVTAKNNSTTTKLKIFTTDLTLVITKINLVTTKVKSINTKTKSVTTKLKLVINKVNF